MTITPLSISFLQTKDTARKLPNSKGKKTHRFLINGLSPNDKNLYSIAFQGKKYTDRPKESCWDKFLACFGIKRWVVLYVKDIDTNELYFLKVNRNSLIKRVHNSSKPIQTFSKNFDFTTYVRDYLKLAPPKPPKKQEVKDTKKDKTEKPNLKVPVKKTEPAEKVNPSDETNIPPKETVAAKDASETTQPKTEEPQEQPADNASNEITTADKDAPASETQKQQDNSVPTEITTADKATPDTVTQKQQAEGAPKEITTSDKEETAPTNTPPATDNARPIANGTITSAPPQTPQKKSRVEIAKTGIIWNDEGELRYRSLADFTNKKRALVEVDKNDQRSCPINDLIFKDFTGETYQFQKSKDKTIPVKTDIPLEVIRKMNKGEYFWVLNSKNKLVKATKELLILPEEPASKEPEKAQESPTPPQDKEKATEQT